MSELSYRSCVLCGQDNSVFLFEKEGLRHVKCKNCEMVYCSPILKESKLLEHYKRTDGWGKKVNNAEEVKRKSKISQNHFNFLKKHLNNESYFLDVGCGSGDFLKTLKRNNLFNLYGVEPNESMQKYIKEEFGISVFGSLDEVENKKFDCISLVKVLEHLDKPDKTILKCRELLKSNGILFLVFPQYSGLSRKLLHENFYGFQSEHINWFNKKTITRFLNDKNFRIIEMKTEKIDLYPVLSKFFAKNRPKNVVACGEEKKNKPSFNVKNHQSKTGGMNLFIKLALKVVFDAWNYTRLVVFEHNVIPLLTLVNKRVEFHCFKKPFSFLFYKVLCPLANQTVSFFEAGDYIVLVARKNEKS